MPYRRKTTRRRAARGGLYRYKLDTTNGWSDDVGKLVPWPKRWQTKYGLGPYTTTQTIPPWFYSRVFSKNPKMKKYNGLYLDSQLPMDFRNTVAKDDFIGNIPMSNPRRKIKGVRLGRYITPADVRKFNLIDPHEEVIDEDEDYDIFG
jgi:hypothetical protein